MGVQVPPAAPKLVFMNKNINIKVLKFLIAVFPVFFVIEDLRPQNFYDYPLHFLVDACKITEERHDPSKFSQDEILKGREKYSICMNFIMSLSTTLNSRCINVDIKELNPEEIFTYADLSKLHTTQELIKEILLYSNENPQFDNQIAWLHAAKAISQKWPCKKLFN